MKNRNKMLLVLGLMAFLAKMETIMLQHLC